MTSLEALLELVARVGASNGAGVAVNELEPIHIIPGARPAVSFVICDKRDDINRVNVPAERLQQWRCDAEAVGLFVAQSLGIRLAGQRKIRDGLWEIGLARGKRRSQMLCLRANGTLELQGK